MIAGRPPERGRRVHRGPGGYDARRAAGERAAARATRRSGTGCTREEGDDLRRRPPRLERLLVALSLAVLLLPLGAVAFFRLYESVLIRRTESDLIAEGAVVEALYHEELARILSPPVGPPLPFG